MSQISVVRINAQGLPVTLWRSPLDLAYAPQIRFVPEIAPHGLPLALVERQTGAASSELDVIGNAAGHVRRILRIDGFKFDVRQLAREKWPSLIVHADVSILDVPEIYSWAGTRFIDDSIAHPGYYRKLLLENRKSLPADSSGAVLLKLSKIAVLADEPAVAKQILENALSRERSRSSAANRQIQQAIERALRALPQSTQ